MGGVASTLAFDWWLPPNASTYGPAVDQLFQIIMLVVVVMFFLTEGAMVIFLIRYRHNPARKSAYIHDHRTLETIWTIIPALVLVFLAVSQQDTWSDIKMEMPSEDDSETYVVRVMAKQFSWHFWYPGPDGQFDTADDFALEKDLYVPVDRPVLLIMRSRDVLHSFFSPHMRLKQDLVPGMEIRAWFQATTTTAEMARQTGREDFTYEIACAELCGPQHYEMEGTIHVEEESAIAAFAAENARFVDRAHRPLLEWWGDMEAAREAHEAAIRGGSE